MGRKDDDDESIWDIPMRPASMDYNFDGKIDDLDLYIEMDELDKALGRGKYDPYEDPYYIAQKEAEEAEEEYEFDGNLDSLAEQIMVGNIIDVNIDADEIVEKYKYGEIDDSTFSTLVDAGYVSYEDLENYDNDEYDGDLDSLAEQIRDGNAPDVNIDAEEIIEKYKCGEIDDSTFSTLADAGYVSYEDLKNYDSDEYTEEDEYDDEEDDEDYDDEDDSQTYTPCGKNSSEKTITLEFSFHNKSEDERKKFPTTGIWQYYNGYDWKFTQALYTFDKKLKEDCGTTYDNCDDSVVSVLGDIYAFDQKRAIADWDWLLKTFPAKILDSSKGESYGMPFSCRLGISTFSRLFNREDYKLLAEYVKQDYVFKYLVEDSVWEKHDYFYLAELLCCYAVDDCDDLFKKCYETVLRTQKDCYSKKDLSEVWGCFFCDVDFADVSDELKNYIKSEIAKIGDFGKPVLKTMTEKEEESEERRRWEEEERLEAEQEAAEAEERRLEEEREAAEHAEREQQIKILEEMSAPLCTKIISGELFDDAYMAVNQQFEYCFGSSRRTYDTVARYILGKNGEIKDINKDLQVGVISSKDIKNIFMLTSTGDDISRCNRVKYGSLVSESESDKKRLEINAPIIEYICRYCYAAKLMQLEEYGDSKSIRYFHSRELYKARDCYRDQVLKTRDDAKAIFNDITNKGEVKVSWVDEKRLFTYAQLNYPDAVYKYAPYWGERLCFDIYIPSLNLIIEYKQELKGGANSADIERHNEEMEKFNKKRKLCEEHDLKFVGWSGNLAINEANFLQFMDKLK